MKAAIAGDDGVEIRDVDEPSVGASEILIKVHAASLNRTDLSVVAARRNVVVGSECAGVVTATGSDATGFRPGDRVMATAAGSFAEYAVTDFGRVHRIPDDMHYGQAACLSMALRTMHNAIVSIGKLAKGESVLIQGASSGVGLLGMQIARQKGASIVIGTSRNEDRRTRLKEFGCDLAIDIGDSQWPEKVKEATNGKGVDLVIDQISGGLVNQNMEAAAIMARIVNVGRLGGMQAEFNFDLHALKRIDYIGVTFRTRTLEEVRSIVTAAYSDLWPAIESGRLALPIDRTYPLVQAADSLARMRSDAHFGKIVLTMDREAHRVGP